MKTWKQFMAGMFTAALIASLIGTALAAGGKLQASSAGVAVMGQTKVEPGKTYAVGEENIPAVVDYTASNGKVYHYLPVEMYTDYLNVWNSWSEQRKSIVLGATMEGVKLEGRVTSAKELLKERPQTAELGLSVGPFTEVSPSLVDTAKKPTQVIDDRTRAQSITGFGNSGTFLPENGKYILLTITNNGTTQVRCQAGLPMTLGVWDRFPSVALEPGKTLIRAFELDGDAPKENNNLLFEIRGAAGTSEPVDVTFSLMQFK